MGYYIFWAIMIAILLLGLRFCLFVAEEGNPFVATLVAVIFVGLWYLFVAWAYDDIWGDHPTFTLRTDRWECTAEVVSQSPPTYVKAGNVMTPVGGGETRECTQYNKRRD